MERGHAAHGLPDRIDPIRVDRVGLCQRLKQAHGHIDLAGMIEAVNSPMIIMPGYGKRSRKATAILPLMPQ